MLRCTCYCNHAAACVGVLTLGVPWRRLSASCSCCSAADTVWSLTPGSAGLWWMDLHEVGGQKDAGTRQDKHSATCFFNDKNKKQIWVPGLPVVADASTTPQEWFRLWPMMRSSLWSRRPSSRMFWTAGHKCSRTKPTMVGLRELLPRRIWGPRVEGGDYSQPQTLWKTEE